MRSLKIFKNDISSEYLNITYFYLTKFNFEKNKKKFIFF